MTDLRKAAEMALETLEAHAIGKDHSEPITKTIQALRQALEESANSTTDFVEPKALAQPPCQTGSQCIGGKCLECEREWVGLTDEESIKLLQKAAKHKSPDYCTAPEMAVEFGRLASEALKEKNT